MVEPIREENAIRSPLILFDIYYVFLFLILFSFSYLFLSLSFSLELLKHGGSIKKFIQTVIRESLVKST